MIENKLTERGEYYLNTALLKMMKDGEVFVPKNLEVWLDCGTPKTLLETNKYLLEKNHRDYSEPENSVVIEPVYIGKNTAIKNSIIGPYVSVGDNVIINDSIIKNSIINNNAQLMDTQLKDSIVGLNAAVKGAMETIDIGDDSKISFREE